MSKKQKPSNSQREFSKIDYIGIGIVIVLISGCVIYLIFW